ncbi:MAG: hypothetical protein IH901_05915, partial [Proteobacteria bacterium]|nr:hypothetical protein [Pseudomonadota bacterium]
MCFPSKFLSPRAGLFVALAMVFSITPFSDSANSQQQVIQKIEALVNDEVISAYDVGQRMGLVLLAISVLVPTGLLYLIRFQARDDGTVMAYLFSNRVGTAAEFVPSALSGLLQMTVGLWLFMGIFAIAPLLTTYLEKGWADLLLSKGVARWQVLLGRYGGGLALFAATLLILDGAPAIYFWARTGIAPGRFFLGVAMLGLSFASVLALMALTAMVQASPSILIIVGFMQVILSSLLA